MRTLLIILTTLAILLLPGLVFCIWDGKAEEKLMTTDAEYSELVMTLDEQALIDRVLLRYEWEDIVQGSTTVTMRAHVE